MCKYLIYYHKLIIVAQSMYERYYRQEKKEKDKKLGTIVIRKAGLLTCNSLCYLLTIIFIHTMAAVAAYNA
jgi:hypothetical protein